jgi:hypothetical protein
MNARPKNIFNQQSFLFLCTTNIQRSRQGPKGSGIGELLWDHRRLIPIAKCQNPGHRFLTLSSPKNGFYFVSQGGYAGLRAKDDSGTIEVLIKVNFSEGALQGLLIYVVLIISSVHCP